MAVVMVAALAGDGRAAGWRLSGSHSPLRVAVEVEGRTKFRELPRIIVLGEGCFKSRYTSHTKPALLVS